MPKQAYLPDLLLWNLNVRSSSAAWEILNLVSLRNIHVAALQEVRLSSNDILPSQDMHIVLVIVPIM